eukprot:scaffold7782_cov113-Isochrysis_galbana.AAC.6
MGQSCYQQPQHTAHQHLRADVKGVQAAVWPLFKRQCRIDDKDLIAEALAQLGRRDLTHHWQQMPAVPGRDRVRVLSAIGQLAVPWLVAILGYSPMRPQVQDTLSRLVSQLTRQQAGTFSVPCRVAAHIATVH